MTHLIEVAFGGNRKGFYQWEGESPPPLRAAVIVEADRGEDLGHVHATGELAETRCRGCSHGCGSAPPPTDRALRLANADEIAQAATLADENQLARKTAHARARESQLVMKFSDAEWQWDRRKLTLYFTAEKRIDFRALVRDLAGVFRARIELKQIGVRDEAKRLSGIGRCGREYCSASWLPDLRPVNLGVAKDQRLSLNPTQISGACGRLMCCLRYEHEFYVQSRRRFPKEGKILRTVEGEVKVMAFDIFRDTVTLRTPDGETRIVPLAQLREEVDGALAGTPTAVLDASSARDDGENMLSDTASYNVESIVTEDDDSVPESLLSAIEYDVEDGDVIGVPAAAYDDTDGDDGDVETDTEAASHSADGGPSDADASGSDAATDGSTNADGSRRKRRRGRRGGRRVRGERDQPKNAGPDAPPPSSTDS